MNIELARVVGEDLEYLYKEWNQDIDEASLRRASPVLRSLLVENKLHTVASDLGMDIRILAPDIHRFVEIEELKTYKYWQAGGARYNGIEIRSTFMVDRVMTDFEIAKMAFFAGKSSKDYPVKAQVFLRQPSFFVEGIAINREEVIKYVVNKLGGGHYDASRNPSLGSDLRLDDKYMLLDKVRAGQLMTGGKDAIYHELLSIGQRLVNSRDVRSLRKRLRGCISSPSIIYT